MVISTCCSVGDAAVSLAEEVVSADMARILLLPLSRRGRLRVKLASASSTGLRGGGEAGTMSAGEAARAGAGACSSTATDCTRSWSRARIVAATSTVFVKERGRPRRDGCGQVKPGKEQAAVRHRQQLHLQP
jgi:hypothetical protein